MRDGFDAELNTYGQAGRVIGPVVGAFAEMPSDVHVIAKAVAEELALEHCRIYGDKTKKAEKRKLNALAQYAESKANTAKTAEQMALESRIETKTLELDVQSDASPSKAAKMRMLKNMQKRADKLEGEHYGAASLDFDDERNAPKSDEAHYEESELESYFHPEAGHHTGPES